MLISGMQMIRKAFFVVILACWGIHGTGCKRAESKGPFEIQAENREREVQAKIAPFADRYHAHVDWSKGLAQKRDGVWTIEIQDALKPKDGSPVVLVGEQEDVERSGDRYFIRLGFDAPWVTTERVNARIECSEEIARRAASVRHELLPVAKVAVVVDVQSAVRPRFKIDGTIQEEGTVDAYPDTVIVAGDGLAIEAKCVDWLFLDTQE